jgi:hypothetical protein
MCLYCKREWSGPESNPGEGQRFFAAIRPVLGPTQSSLQWVRGLFPGGKAAGAWR